jgi:hypothetical protein
MKSATVKPASDDFIAPAKRAFLSVARQLRAENASATATPSSQVGRAVPKKLARSSAR